MPIQFDHDFVMAVLLQEHRPKAYFTNTVLHNPTGVSLNQAHAFRILRLAEQHNFIIVEEDIFSDLHAAPETRLSTLDQLDRVIYISSFSKTLSANMRVGYLAARPDLLHELADLELLCGLTTSELHERLIYQILSEGHYRKCIQRLRNRLQKARECTVLNLERIGYQPYCDPAYGMLVWAKTAVGSPSPATLANRAADYNIMLAPGEIFRPHQEPSDWLRFNVGFCDDSRIFEFLERQAEIRASNG